MNLLLVDKSAYEVRARSEEARTALSELLAAGGVISMCEVISLELLYSARNSSDYERLRTEHTKLTWLPTTNAALQRAIDIQHQLAHKGQHRRAIPDLLIAATAEEHEATVVHYDKDFDLIAEVTGQPTRWVVPAGTC